jgi:hypothetical protein
MPAETITLTQDQAEDLRELLSHAEIPEDWLLHASDDILDELARFAYYGHFHPYSAAWWLIEDLGHLRCRLRKTLPGHHHEQDRPAVAHSIKAIAETGTSPTASSRDGLDTATSIGNHERCFRRSWLVGPGGREPVAEGDSESVQGGLPSHRPPGTAGPGRVQGPGDQVQAL